MVSEVGGTTLSWINLMNSFTGRTEVATTSNVSILTKHHYHGNIEI